MDITQGGFSKINLKLFTINNEPLKFNLDGCVADKFNGIIKTIETFGGELADSRKVDTIIFSDRNLRFTLPCERFDSQFIYDSIVAQKLQNLEDYRIVPIDRELKSSAIKRRREKISTGIDCKEINEIQLDNPVENPKRGEAKNEGESCENSGISPSGHQSSDEDTDSSVDRIARRRQQRKQKRTTRIVSSSDEVSISTGAKHLPDRPCTKRIENASSNNSSNINNAVSHEGDIASLTRSDLDYEITAKRPRAGDPTKLLTPCSRSTLSLQKSASLSGLENPPVVIEKLLKSILKNGSMHTRRDHICGSTSTTNTEERADLMKEDGAETTPRELCNKSSKVSEHSKNVPENYQIPSTSKEPAKITTADCQLSEKPKTKSFQNTGDNDDRSGNSDDDDGGSGDDDDDGGVSVKSEVSESCDVSKESEFDSETSKSTFTDSGSCYSPESSGSEYRANVSPYKTKKSERGKQKRPRHFFTEDENGRMIQYLINNQAIHRATGLGIWREFLVDEAVNEPKPTADTLLRHFKIVLEKNYRKYTNDPIALRKFEEKIASRQSSRIPWSEEEHQFMIDYVITNKGIHLMSTKIWQQCLEASPLLQKSRRTAYSLRSRFTQHLRYNYAKYTNDPDALLRFKEMEIRAPPQRAKKNPVIDSCFFRK